MSWLLGPLHLSIISVKKSVIGPQIDKGGRPWLPTKKTIWWDVGDSSLAPCFKHYTVHLSMGRIQNHQSFREASSRVFAISPWTVGQKSFQFSGRISSAPLVPIGPSDGGHGHSYALALLWHMSEMTFSFTFGYGGTVSSRWSLEITKTMAKLQSGTDCMREIIWPCLLLAVRVQCPLSLALWNLAYFLK